MTDDRIIDTPRAQAHPPMGESQGVEMSGFIGTPSMSFICTPSMSDIKQLQRQIDVLTWLLAEAIAEKAEEK